MSDRGTPITRGNLAALRRYARPEPLERCDLCAEPIPAEHRHLLDVTARQFLCVCYACSLLFDREAASDGKYRLVSDRHLDLGGLPIDDAAWARLGVPVGMAFFAYSSPAGRMLAYYPSPMGATESEMDQAEWEALVAQQPILRTLQPDVEALLVNRARGARDAFIVPLDQCFALEGVVRQHWRGLSGGSQVWREIDAFFAALRSRSKPAPPAD